MGNNDGQFEDDVFGIVPVAGRSPINLATYLPRGFSLEEWFPVRLFVVRHLARMSNLRELETSMPAAISRLAAWAVKEGLPLETEVVLHPDNVNRFLHDVENELSERTLAYYRWALKRAGLELTKKAPWPPKAPGYSNHGVSAPYTVENEHRLWSDAERQSTWLRRRVAGAVLAVGLGCGLSPGEVQRLQSDQILDTPEGLVVRIAGRIAREVPVVAEYADRVRYFADDSLDGMVVVPPGKDKDGLNRLIHKMRWGRRTPALDVRRLRSTWIVRHLDRGVRLPDLMMAAGIKQTDAFRSLIRYVEPLDESERRQMLTGAR